MTVTGRIWWFAVVLSAAVLALAACDRGPSSGISDANGIWGNDEEELHTGLVPATDIWAEERPTRPQWSREETASEDYLSRAARHREFMQAGVPLEYLDRENPYPATTRFVAEGGRLYESNCARCHGPTGLGDGTAGRDLTPPPALLAYLIDRPRSVDDYLLWTISEGGKQFGTEMPAFKSKLTEQQIWQIVVYMRDGFPNIPDQSG